ncbi:MAG: hypothetical protein M1820_006786 [Bogoriella megaspora]|nr:MAG: hypothetical protein M1820_006786 [Bogoriella megaspora]
MSDYNNDPYTNHRNASRDHRRHSKRRSRHYAEDYGIAIRFGSRRSRDRYMEMRAVGPRDKSRFEDMIKATRELNPNDPLLLKDGADVDRAELTRAVYQTDQLWFPERSSRRSRFAPWSFIVDEMNLPDVFWWSLKQDPPESEDLESIDSYRLRIGVWTCREGAYTHNAKVPVTIIFTQPTKVQENIVKYLAFKELYEDEDYNQHSTIEEAVSWMFLRLYLTFTDWQNILKEVELRLQAAQTNSKGRKFPVRYRAITMHKEVDRIYDLLAYLNFHLRSFGKLRKLKPTALKDAPNDESEDLVWTEVEDQVEDLQQIKDELGYLKERFDNLIEFEFNISNADQAEDSSFLSTIATLFLPISYLASIFGITTFNGSPMLYLEIALPVLFISLLFTIFFTRTSQQFQKLYYHGYKERPNIQATNFTMIGEEVPDAVDVGEDMRSNNRGRFDGEKYASASPAYRERSTSRVRKRSH